MSADLRRAVTDLRNTARHIQDRFVVADTIDRYYGDRDVNANSRDVYWALTEAANALEASK